MESRGVALLAVLAGALAFAAPLRAATYTQGIDVSHYQGGIQWSSVASTPTQFAFGKATEGKTIVDVSYPINRSGAEGVGIHFGAYHFARPGGSGEAAIVADAIAQADFFLNIAQPQPGELPPVLDLEAKGGLTSAELLTWTSAWLDEIDARTGLRAAVYTSPNFWKTALADTGAVALAGNPLWVAHWTTAAAPLVPAANWGGRSWTFWQWSSSSHVSGISTAVDADRFRGSSLSTVAIPPYPGGAPAPSAPPTVVGSAQTGKRLTAVPGTWTGGKPLTFSYQWLRCDAGGAGCAAIPGAAAATYLPSVDDVGHALALTVTAQAAGGSATATSPATVAVGTAGTTVTRPAATTAPSIGGSAEAGQTLTSSVGAWTGSPTTFAYQWQRCSAAGTQCVAILDATASSYTLTAGDIGAVVGLLVTATGRGGSASATAPPTAAVASAPVPAAVPDSAVASASSAGAVAAADGSATVTWQPGAVPAGTTVTLTHTGATFAFDVEPHLPQLPFPVDLALAQPTDQIVGYSTDGKVYRPPVALPTPVLPLTKPAGLYTDASGLPHVLLRGPASVRLFAPNAWGDPRLVAAGAPQPHLVGRLRTRRLRSGVVVVTGRVAVPSQALLTVNVPGKTSAKRSRLARPGSVPVRVAISGRRLAHRAPATLRVAARDPYGRTASLVARFHAP